MSSQGFHYVKRNHGTEQIYNIAFVSCADAETTDTDGVSYYRRFQQLRAGTIRTIRKGSKGWYGRNSISFSSAEFFWQFIRERSKPQKPVTVFGYDWHRLAQLTGLWTELDQGRFWLTIPSRKVLDGEGKVRDTRAWNGMLAIDEKPFIVYMLSACGCVKLIDVKNYFDVPVRKLAESFGVELPEPIHNGSTGEECKNYIERECEAIELAMTRTMDAWNEGNHGNWAVSAARLAWNNFRHEYWNDHKLVVKSPKIDRADQRKAFYGGEVNSWFRGIYHGNVWKVDVNGLYPFIMANGNFPRDVAYVAGDQSIVGKAIPTDCYECQACVDVVGCGDLPGRDEHRATCYPFGEFTTVLCGPELEFAVENCRVTKVHSWTRYRLAPIFQRFVAYWWARRKQAEAMGDLANKQLAKTLVNSLFGRLSARSKGWENVDYVKPGYKWGFFCCVNPDSGKAEKHRVVGGVVQRVRAIEEKKDTLPITSAYITAEGRMFMRYVRSLLPKKSCFGQQTDSFLLTDEGKAKLEELGLVDDTELGKFKVVDQYAWIQMWGGNSYMHHKGECLAGCPERRFVDGVGTFKTFEPDKTVQMIARGPLKVIPVRIGQYRVMAKKTNQCFGEDGWAVEE